MADKMPNWLKQHYKNIHDVLHKLGSKYVKNEMAIELVLATGLVESKFRYTRQVGSEIARGFFQVEADTAIDTVENYLKYRESLQKKCAEVSDTPLDLWQSTDKKRWEFALTHNNAVGIIICRLKYWRSPKPLPKTLSDMGVMWKMVYNTEDGAGTTEHFEEIVGKYI